MTNFFMNIDFLEQQSINQKRMPSLEDLVLLFESLDQDKDGLLSQSDIRFLVENVDQLKAARFNVDKFIEQRNKDEDKDKVQAAAQNLTEEQRDLEEQIASLLGSFVTDKDRAIEAITPEEFFNIIMMLYEQ